MPQLVGTTCVICDQRIASVMGAGFCDKCGNPRHDECQDKFTLQGNAHGCDKCGGDPAKAPPRRVVHASHPERWALAAGIVLLIGIAFAFVGTTIQHGNPGDVVAQAAQDQNENQPIGETKSKKEKLPVVVIETTKGTIKAKLFTDKAPKTAQNFIDLVKQEYYDGIIFHRVIKDFMIQTGDPTGTGRGGRTDKGLPAKKLQDEFHADLRHNKAGILSMANAGPNTGDTQFFITTVPTPWLDDKHAVFGEVIEGMDVVKQLEGVRTGAQDRPVEEIKMTKVYLDDEKS